MLSMLIIIFTNKAQCLYTKNKENVFPIITIKAFI